MEKPLSIKREDFVEAIVKAVNESGLPPCVCLEVMTKMTEEVAKLAQSHLERDKKLWAEAQKEANDV